MRKLTANYIYSCNSGFLKYGIIILDDKNSVIEIINTNGIMKEIEGLEFYSGLLVSGRIERLELSGQSRSEELSIEMLLDTLLRDKPSVGVTLIEDADLINFKIKTSARLRIIA